jgi:cob(I)alamin adenosyltransferase
VCRAVTRRAERAVFDLVQGGDCEPVVGRYLNRLSDFFFVAARFASMKNNRPEIVYKKE